MTEVFMVASAGADAVRLIVTVVAFAAILAFWYFMISRLGSF